MRQEVLGQTVRIQCRANTGAIHRRTSVLFEPDKVGQWSSGLIVLESLTTVKEGDGTILPVTVTDNNTKHNVNLPGRVALESLQLVRSVTPVEVKFKEPEMVAKEDESLNEQSMPDLPRNSSTGDRLPPVDWYRNSRSEPESYCMRKQIHLQQVMMSAVFLDYLTIIPWARVGYEVLNSQRGT